MEDKVITSTTINGENYKFKDEDAARTSELTEEIANRKAADNTLSTELGQKQDTLSETQLQAVNSGINAEGVAQISTNTEAIQNLGEDVATIETKIPDQASAENQLADKSFVNSSVQTATANFRGNWANFAAVPTDAAQYPADYAGSTTPTTNDYLVLQDASDFPVAEGEPALAGTWRLKYTGDWATVGKNGWTPEYQVNETPLTSDQLAALNSGITSAAVTKLTGIEAGAEVNEIDSISLNGTALTPDANKNVEITTPTYSDFTGTDGSTAGTNGLVPAPATTDAGKFLKADGTWDDAGSSVNVVQTTGTSMTDVMSQGASHALVYADWYRTDTTVPVWAQTIDKVRIGQGFGQSSNSGTYSQGDWSVLIGANGTARGQFAVHIGSGGGSSTGQSSLGFQHGKADGAYSVAFDGGETSTQGVFTIGIDRADLANQGYNSSSYRLLTGLYDPQSDHDAATKGYVDSIGGDLSTLTTTDKNNLVAAINELVTRVAALEGS